MSDTSSDWRKNVTLIVATLILASIGGYLFSLLQMPLAWMIGAMIFTTVASLAGAPLKASPQIRTCVIPVLGIMLGSAFTPETLDGITHWLPSLGSMIGYVIFSALTIGALFYRFVGVGPITAFFSATPGGLATMVLIGRDAGGDERAIALTHAVRVLLTVLIIPLWFRVFEGYEPGGMTALGSVSDLGLTDAAVMLLTAVAGIYGGRLIRLPSAQLLGPMILSAVLHAGGFTSSKPPFEIVNIAQVAIGAMIGARFAGVAIRQVLRVMSAAILSTLFLVALAAAIAALLAEVTDLPFRALWLAFAPGGLAEMTLISLSLNIDPAFVSTHHLLRVMFMVLAAPLLFKFLQSALHIEGDEPWKKPEKSPPS